MLESLDIGAEAQEVARRIWGGLGALRRAIHSRKERRGWEEDEVLSCH